MKYGIICDVYLIRRNGFCLFKVKSVWELSGRSRYAAGMFAEVFTVNCS